MSRRPKTISAALNNRTKKVVTRSNSAASSVSSNRSDEVENAYEQLLQKYKSVELEAHNLRYELNSVRDENQRLRIENERLTNDNAYFMKTREHKEYEISELHDKLEETTSMKRGSKFASMVGKLQLKLKRRPTLETLSRNGYYKDEPCFGNDLNITIIHEVHFDVPKVLVESVKVLESSTSYMKSLGLYRISGSHTVIQKLRYKINSNNYNMLCEQTDPNNITGLIKLFFRELRRPMISLNQIRDTIPKEYSFFADAKTDGHYRVEKMRMLIDKLARKYRSTLKFVVGHLKRVADIPENDMTPYTLSIVIGACICYETMANVYFDPELCRIPNKCIEVLIQHYHNNRQIDIGKIHAARTCALDQSCSHRIFAPAFRIAAERNESLDLHEKPIGEPMDY